MRNFITAVLLLSFVSVFSQDRPAIIYFNDSTSIKGFGEIKIKAIGFLKKQVIMFRASTNDVADEWDESMVSGIKFISTDEIHKFVYIIPGKREDPVLAEVLVEGNVTLYIDRLDFLSVFRPLNLKEEDDYQAPGIVEKDYVYVKRASEQYPTFLNGKFKTKATAYFHDCETLVARINDNKYSWATLQDMVEFYNDYCIE